MQKNNENNPQKAGIVYVLTNQGMPDLVKIGRTVDLPARLNAHNAKAVPFPFDFHHAVEVEDAKSVEDLLFKTFADNRVHKRREFFRVKPEQVVAALGLILINGRVVGKNHKVENAEDDTPPDIANITEDEIEAHEKRARRRTNFRFKSLGIPVGAVLTFARNPELKATVIDDKNAVEYEGEQTTVSKAATKILGGTTYVNGAYHWKREGKTLYDIRAEKEKAEDESEDDS